MALPFFRLQTNVPLMRADEKVFGTYFPPPASMRQR